MENSQSHAQIDGGHITPQLPDLASDLQTISGGRALWIATMDSLWPWSDGYANGRAKKYPGRLACASAATGYSRRSVDNWRYQGFGVPTAAVDRIIAHLRSMRSMIDGLLDAWIKYREGCEDRFQASIAETFEASKRRKAARENVEG